jgi:hypothetical protein
VLFAVNRQPEMVYALTTGDDGLSEVASTAISEVKLSLAGSNFAQQRRAKDGRVPVFTRSRRVRRRYA